MLYQLHTGWVPEYHDGQEPIVYLVSTCQEIVARGLRFVFSDGHGIAFNTKFFHNLDDLEEVDWDMAYAKIWIDNDDDMDRQRRKQAEFLVHEFCPWEAIQEIGVINQARKKEVETVLARFSRRQQPVVGIHRNWYY